jgi:transposase
MSTSLRLATREWSRSISRQRPRPPKDVPSGCAWSCPGFDDTWTLPIVSRRKLGSGARTRPPYPEEFRREAIRLAQLGDKPQRQLAKDLGISDVTLRNWLKQERAERGERPGGLSQDEREELQRLRDENARLRMEREILSKAAVFFAKESDGR